MQPQTDEHLDSQTIHQQSHERTRGWSRAGFRRVPEELDYSSEPVEFGFWNPSHQCRTYRGSAWMPSSPSLVLGRGCVCFEVSTIS